MDETEIILDVKADTSDALRNIQSLKEANERLKQSIVEDKKELSDLKKSTEEAGGATAEEAQRMQELSDAIETNTAEVKVNTQAINANIKVVESSVAQTRLAGDSIAAMRKKSAELTAQWNYMSAAEREGAAGQELKTHLKELNDGINEAMLSVGSFKDNIGNYRSAVGGLVVDNTALGKALKVVGVDLQQVAEGGLSFANVGKMLKNGISSLGQALKGLALNPVFAVMAAFLLVCQQVSAAIKRSEETSNALEVSLASLRPITDAITQAFDYLAKVVVQGFTAVMETLQKLVTYAAKAADFISGLFGRDSEMAKSIEESIETQKQIVKAEQELTKARRQFATEEARSTAEIEELRARAAEKDKYTFEERRRYIEEAIEIEKRLAERRTELAEEDLRIKKAEAERSENDAAANEALAQAETEVIKARASALQKTRQLEQQRQSFLEGERREREAAAKAARDHAAAIAKALQDIVDAAKKAEAELEAERQRIDEASEAQITANAATWRAAQTKILQGELQTLQQSQELRRAARDYEASEERTYQEKMQSERLRLKELQVEEENARYEAARDATFANELLTEEARLNTLDTLQMEHDANRMEIERQYQSEREKLQRETDARILESQEDAEKTAEQMSNARLSVVQSNIKAVGQVLQEYADESEGAFEAMKAINIAAALIDTYKAANDAYAAMASIPYVGPALGAAAAAAAVVAGMAQVNAIRNTKPGTSGGGSASSAGGSSSSVITPTPTYYAAGAIQSGNTQAIGSTATGTERQSFVTTEQLVEVVEHLPSPVVNVQDINEGQEAVATRTTAVQY